MKPRLFKSGGQWGCYRPGGTVMTFGSTPKIAYDGWAWQKRHEERYAVALERQSRPQSFLAWLLDGFVEEVEIDNTPTASPLEHWKAFKAIYARATPAPPLQ